MIETNFRGKFCTYLEFNVIELFPDKCEAVIDSLKLEQEKEESVVLIHALLTDYSVQWMLSFVIESDILTDLILYKKGLD